MSWKYFCSHIKNLRIRNFVPELQWKKVESSSDRSKYGFEGMFYSILNRLYVTRKACLRSMLLQYKLFTNSERNKLAISTLKRFLPKNQPVYILAGAVCSFSWDDHAITNEDIWDHINELNTLQDIESKTYARSSSNEESITVPNLPPAWETVVDEPNLKIWKLPYKDTGYMQYKVFGRFFDVTARQFFDVQSDLEYRKKWDKLAIDINVVEENQTTGEQVLRWIAYFPYPFSAREYVYIRRQEIYEEANVLAILARSVDHPKCTLTNRYVRVPLYISDMVIRPHTNIDEPGIDYLLTYCDDPQTSIPSALSSWVVSAGIPDYIEKLHKAALNINKNTGTDNLPQNTQSNFYNNYFNSTGGKMNTV